MSEPPDPTPASLDVDTPQLVRDAASPTHVGGFLVDPERASVAVAKLDEVIDRLTSTLGMFIFRNYVEPPGADHVSARIAQNTVWMIGNAHDYVQALRQQVLDSRDALRAQVDAYQRADDPGGFRG